MMAAAGLGVAVGQIGKSSLEILTLKSLVKIQMEIVFWWNSFYVAGEINLRQSDKVDIFNLWN